MNSIAKPLAAYCDKSTTVFFLKNIKSRSYGKHIDIKYLVVRDKIKNQEVIIEHVATYDMIVDLITKAFLIKVFANHVESIRLA
jgi:hypothetical protein